MDKIKNLIIPFILKNPYKALIISLLSIIIMSLGLSKMTMLFGLRAWFHDTDPLIVKLNTFEKKFGTSESALLVIYNQEGIFQKDVIQYIHTLTDKLWYVDSTYRVESITNFTNIWSIKDDIFLDDYISEDEELTQAFLDKKKKLALDDPNLVNRLISKDAKTTLIFVNIKSYVGKKLKYRKIVNDYEKLIHDLPPPPNTVVKLTGNPSVTHAFERSAATDISILIPLLTIILTLLLYLKFKSGKLIFITYATLAVTIFSMLGLAGYISIPFHNLLSVSPEFIIAIGIADLIHILATYYVYRKSFSPLEAIGKSMYKNFIPTIMTSITTAIGFASFMTGDIKNISDMGIVTAIGALLAWFFTYFFSIPLCILYINNQVDNTKKLININIKSYVDFLLKYKKSIYISNILFCVICAVCAYNIEVNSNPLKYFTSRIPLKEVVDFVEDHIGGVFSLEMQVDAKIVGGIKDPELLKKVELFQHEVTNKYPQITKIVSINNILKKLNQVMNENKKENYLLPKNRAIITDYITFYNLSVPEGKNLNDRVTIKEDQLRITGMLKNMDSRASVSMFKDINKIANKLGLNLTVTGKRYLWQCINEKVVISFILSLFAALALISILISVFLKSIKVGIISIIPNLIPIITTALVMFVLGRDFDIGTSIVASIVLGIAVDDTIHIAANYMKGIKANIAPREILINLFEETAPALIITTLILSISFFMFVFATFIPNQNLGLLMAITLLVALICDLTLFPILLYDLVKPKNP